jgi:MYXO-CTERM domain-containing protein
MRADQVRARTVHTPSPMKARSVQKLVLACTSIAWVGIVGAARAEGGAPCSDAYVPVEVFSGSSCTGAQYVLLEVAPSAGDPSSATVARVNGCGREAALPLPGSVTNDMPRYILIGTAEVEEVFGVEPDVVMPDLDLHPTRGAVITDCGSFLRWIDEPWPDRMALRTSDAENNTATTPAPTNSRGERGDAPICDTLDGGRDSGTWPPPLVCRPPGGGRPSGCGPSDSTFDSGPRLPCEPAAGSADPLPTPDATASKPPAPPVPQPTPLPSGADASPDATGPGSGPALRPNEATPSSSGCSCSTVSSSRGTTKTWLVAAAGLLLLLSRRADSRSVAAAAAREVWPGIRLGQHIVRFARRVGRARRGRM